MTKIEQLTAAASALTDKQIDCLIEQANYLAGEPYLRSASPELLASIERGLAEHRAGNTMPAEEVFERLRRAILPTPS